jgi:hypothetical protein
MYARKQKDNRRRWEEETAKSARRLNAAAMG